MNKFFILIFTILLGFSSCTSSRYLSKNTQLSNIIIKQYNTKNIPYKIQPYDYLYISIKSTNEEINKLYNQISSQFSGGSGGEASFFLTGYLINDSGYVYIPTIGNVFVKGLTIDQTRELIQNKVNTVLTDAVVNVRLTSFNVTFIGEVSNTGQVSFYKEKVNILEGIGKAGGITNYGDLKHIKILRPTDSLYEIYSINLSNKNIIGLKEFYLNPNDIVYVPPKKSKDVIDFFSDYSTFITVFTSTITTALLIIQFYKK